MSAQEAKSYNPANTSILIEKFKSFKIKKRTLLCYTSNNNFVSQNVFSEKVSKYLELFDLRLSTHLSA